MVTRLSCPQAKISVDSGYNPKSINSIAQRRSAISLAVSHCSNSWLCELHAMIIFEQFVLLVVLKGRGSCTVLLTEPAFILLLDKCVIEVQLYIYSEVNWKYWRLSFRFWFHLHLNLTFHLKLEMFPTFCFCIGVWPMENCMQSNLSRMN